MLEEKLAEARRNLRKIIVVIDDELENLLKTKFVNKVTCEINKYIKIISITFFNAEDVNGINQLFQNLICIHATTKKPKDPTRIFGIYEDSVKVKVPLLNRNEVIEALNKISTKSYFSDFENTRGEKL